MTGRTPGQIDETHEALNSSSFCILRLSRPSMLTSFSMANLSWLGFRGGFDEMGPVLGTDFHDAIHIRAAWLGKFSGAAGD
ncbi:MAG: hypothetical protein JO114_16250 [Planctomycetaceae bacterium]|nr:hypothetical protein [Planctomycetaceae bacterium]MBV8310732.1 hypothetical protein [Planctomycetaceae bacterium]